MNQLDYNIEKITHSGFGIVSTVMGCGAALFFMYEVPAYLTIYTTTGVRKSQVDIEAVFAFGLAFYITITLAGVGLFFGIIGGIQPARKRMYCYVGVGVNGVIVLLNLLACVNRMF